jgi:hypothetical protein
MRSRSTLVAVLFLFIATAANAQDAAGNKIVVPLPEGGFVSFKNESAWIDLRRALLQRNQLPSLAAQALADRNQTIHRVLRNQDGRFVFGYDLWVSSDVRAKRFTVAIRPLDPQLAAGWGIESSAEALSTFPKSTEPQTIDDGGEFSLDLLINENSGVKIVDVVRVSFDRSRLGDEPRIRARDLSLDAVAMEMKDYVLFTNQELIATGKSKSGAAGALLWIYIPGRGRFIFSLTPRPDYAFQKVGTVSGNRIEFELNGVHYEWLSSSAILREEGAWNLWVLPDPHYAPLIGGNLDPPPHDPGTLEKLDKTISSIGQKSPATVGPKPNAGLQAAISNRMEQNLSKLRNNVMFGAADRIEILLPRN